MAITDYPNGRIPYSELTQIDNGQYLEPNAAIRWMNMRIFAATQGVSLGALEGYRDYDTQVYLRELYLAGLGNPAGIPGTSKHGLGLAVDVANVGPFGSAKYNWLAANAPSFGFSNDQGIGDGEPWHWVYVGGGTAGNNGTPFPVQEETKGEKMIPAKLVDGENRFGPGGKTYFIFAAPGLAWKPYTEAGLANKVSSFYGENFPNLTYDEWSRLKQIFDPTGDPKTL